jgi:hypothetical protein
MELFESEYRMETEVIFATRRSDFEAPYIIQNVFLCRCCPALLRLV